MNTELTCEFCFKSFSSKSNLSTHKTRAKYCISKRNDNVIPDISYKCSYCEKSFTTKQFLTTHKTKCSNKIPKEQSILLEQKLEEQKLLFEIKLQEKEKIMQEKDNLNYTLKTENKNLREQIESLQQKLASIAIEGVRKPTKTTTKITNNTTTTNNVTQILSPFDLEQKDILGIIENNLDENSFLNSQRGIAKFCVDNILKTEDGKMRMICSDPSRERFKYMDDKGVIKDDIQARQFIEKIYPPIHQVGEKIHESIIEKCKTQNMKIAKGEDKTDKYLVKIREEAANNSWMEIRFIKSQTSNGTFRKELAILSNV